MRKLYCLIKKHGSELMLFLTVGSFSALFKLSVFTALWKGLDLSYQMAVSVAYVSSVLLHFYGNRKVTFKNASDSMAKQIPKYLTVVLINYFITLFIMHVTVEIFELSPFIGLLFAISCTVGIGFSLLRFWVFIAAKE